VGIEVGVNVKVLQSSLLVRNCMRKNIIMPSSELCLTFYYVSVRKEKSMFEVRVTTLLLV
jgi:hypothetical protein